MNAMSAYGRLEDRFRRLSALGGASAVLSWDRQTMMPRGGSAARAEQLATLAVLGHELLTAPEVADWLAEASADQGLDAGRRANLKEMRRRHAHASALPQALVDARERASNACEHVWVEARAEADFARVLPTLEPLLDLVREEAAAKAAALGKSPYDALLDGYEPDGSSARIGEIFDRLRAVLPGLLERVLERQAKAGPVTLPEVKVPADRQAVLGRHVMQAMGFDFTHGRLDVSAHPFTGGVPEDVRLTTRYKETDPVTGLMGVVHETGHALYELGLPEAWRHQPAGEARGMVMHESQSLIFEMQIARSPAFCNFLSPLLVTLLGVPDAAADAGALHRRITRVRRGMIRVDADEVTYPLHVMLRFELEQALLSGDLRAADLPGAWRDGMTRLVGTAPESDREGCLQDIHWYAGSVGYFPTYTLGALAAAQLRAALGRAVPDLDGQVASGDFSGALGWLRDMVHRKASLMPTDALLTEATGAPLSEADFLAHLERRYLG